MEVAILPSHPSSCQLVAALYGACPRLYDRIWTAMPLAPAPCGARPDTLCPDAASLQRPMLRCRSLLIGESRQHDAWSMESADALMRPCCSLPLDGPFTDGMSV